MKGKGTEKRHSGRWVSRCREANSHFLRRVSYSDEEEKTARAKQSKNQRGTKTVEGKDGEWSGWRCGEGQIAWSSCDTHLLHRSAASRSKRLEPHETYFRRPLPTDLLVLL